MPFSAFVQCLACEDFLHYLSRTRHGAPGRPAQAELSIGP